MNRRTLIGVFLVYALTLIFQSPNARKTLRQWLVKGMASIIGLIESAKAEMPEKQSANKSKNGQRKITDSFKYLMEAAEEQNRTIDKSVRNVLSNEYIKTSLQRTEGVYK
ncbi:hypothetical protein [Siminovitchia terrae]|uniref:Uncharacterized protein n=1 Tax=Siminovitchia terrae TaxID=1914933 RepID=A0A429XBP4_SIMTE|nr:hypothetical protein [Siminovitchia terrae]RST60701.1 hypothetical protein D5F11_004950 [Siminovitchia terrae]